MNAVCSTINQENGLPWVRVVIVNYQAGPWLERVLTALAAQSDPLFEAVIVDNGAAHGPAATIPLPDPRFQLWPMEKNWGFAAGCNLGARGAHTEWLAMLNPDAIPEADWLASLRQATLRYPDTMAFGSTQIDGHDPDQLDGCGDQYSIFGLAWRGGHGARQLPPAADFRPFSPCAAAALYRRTLFEQVGGFAEEFFCYLEDVDLGFRLNLMGYQTVQVAAARVAHASSVITGRRSPFTLYHSARNGIFLLLRCMPAPLLLLALPLYLLAQSWLALQHGKGTARMMGVWAGIRRIGPVWRQRHTIREQRRLSLRQLCRLLVWNPMTVSKRLIVPLPFSHAPPS